MRFASLAPLVLLAACSQSEETAAPADPSPTARAEPGAGAAPPRYTSLVECELTRSVPEEAGFFEYDCPGEGGYRLRKTQSDLRDNVVVLAPDGSEFSLGLPALANGAFSSVGERAEWRGDGGGETFAPRALILRQSVMEDPDPNVPEVSYLVVARLGSEPCVAARIEPGPDQNEKARLAADRADTCLPAPG